MLNVHQSSPNLVNIPVGHVRRLYACISNFRSHFGAPPDIHTGDLQECDRERLLGAIHTSAVCSCGQPYLAQEGRPLHKLTTLSRQGFHLLPPQNFISQLSVHSAYRSRSCRAAVQLMSCLVLCGTEQSFGPLLGSTVTCCHPHGACFGHNHLNQSLGLRRASHNNS